MNYYTYLKKEINNNNEHNIKKYKILYVWNISNIVLNLIFSSFFIAYFVKLANFVWFSFHKMNVSSEWLSKELEINNALLGCMIVFWTFYIFSFLWQFILFQNFKKQFHIELKNEKIINYFILFLSVIGLFLCFIGLFVLVWYQIFLLKIKRNFLK